MEIPFDRKMAEAYSKGEMIMETMPEWRKRFTGLFHQIEEIVPNKKSRS